MLKLKWSWRPNKIRKYVVYVRHESSLGLNARIEKMNERWKQARKKGRNYKPNNYLRMHSFPSLFYYSMSWYHNFYFILLHFIFPSYSTERLDAMPWHTHTVSKSEIEESGFLSFLFLGHTHSSIHNIHTHIYFILRAGKILLFFCAISWRDIKKVLRNGIVGGGSKNYYI